MNITQMMSSIAMFVSKKDTNLSQFITVKTANLLLRFAVSFLRYVQFYILISASFEAKV